jgi:hypothetical protein
MRRSIIVVAAALCAAGFSGSAFADGGSASAAGSADTPPPAPASAPPASADTPPPAPAASPPASGGAPTPTRAPAPLDEMEKGLWDAKQATYRSGFTAGLMLGLSFGTVTGYPNDFSKWDVEAYRSATSGVGTGAMIYLGGALTDWFTFGVGYQGTSYGGTDNYSREWAILFHTEVFPLFAMGRTYRDIGVFANIGTGMATINRRSDNAEYASSGSMSIGGLGAFWETWRLAGQHLAVGPYLSGTFENSDSITRIFGVAGVRGTFYGGP